MAEKTILNWQTPDKFPEDAGLEIVETFACDYIPVLVTGRFEPEGTPLVFMVNRMKRKATGNKELDESHSLLVPLDGKWHWQTTMSEIMAWSPIPNKDDPRWIPCAVAMPESLEKIHSFCHMQMVSVMGLCEIFEDFFDVKLINRVNVEHTNINYLDQNATNGWEWSSNAGKVKAWMPFPEPYKELEQASENN